MTPLFWNRRRVFVTGATGLVGSAVTSMLLERQADIVILERDHTPDSECIRSGSFDRVNVVRGDLSDPMALERILGEYEVQTVLHLAAQAIVGVANRNPLSTFESNVRGTWNLLDACRRSPLVSEIVVASSDKAYGEQPLLPYTEDMPLLARNPYDVSKACTDLIAQSYASAFDMPIVLSRCGNFYGPGDLNWNRIIPGTIRSILRKESPIIRSDGSLVRDYLYVDDGAEAYLLLAEHLVDKKLHGEVFNFSTEECCTVLDITHALLKEMGSSLQPVILDEVKHEIAAQHLSAKKARDVLGWRSKHSLQKGLEKTIPWYRALLKAS
jgi:CDP-glucose 4,6-dehydratase